MDHGVTMGPIDGLIDINKTCVNIIKNGADTIVVHKGIVASIDINNYTGLIIHLSASTCLNPDCYSKTSICDVEEALSLGADAVSVHINLGSETESAMLEFLGKTSKECNKWGVPLLAMMYPKGNNIDINLNTIKLAARVGGELGADIVKCPYTGEANSFKEVVRGCPVPIVVAGGALCDNIDILNMVEGAMEAGALGLSMGRNVFQHKNPELLLQVACDMVHNELPKKEALKILENTY